MDRIVGYCADKNMYRVRWKGYLEDEDTWEPFQHLNEAAQTEAVAYKQTCENKWVKMPEHAKEVCEAESTRDECVAEQTEPEAEACNHGKEVPNPYVIKTTFSQETEPRKQRNIIMKKKCIICMCKKQHSATPHTTPIARYWGGG